MSGFLFSGRFYVDFFNDSGEKTGFVGPLNTTQLEIQHQDPDVVERISNMPQNRGQALDSVSIPKPQQIQISTDEQVDDDTLSPEVLARAFAGAVESVSQSLETGAPFAGVAYLGKAVNLGKRHVTEDSVTMYKGATVATGKAYGQATGATGTVLTDAGQAWTEDDLIGSYVLIYDGTGAGEYQAITDNDATTLTVAAFGTTPDSTSKYAIISNAELTEGVDFTVDHEAGIARILASSVEVTNGDWVGGTLDCPAMSGYQIQGAQEPTVTFAVYGYGVNLATKKKGWLEVDKVEAKVAENPDLANNEFLNTVLSGTLITLPGQTAPYRFNVEMAEG